MLRGWELSDNWLIKPVQHVLNVWKQHATCEFNSRNTLLSLFSTLSMIIRAASVQLLSTLNNTIAFYLVKKRLRAHNKAQRFDHSAGTRVLERWETRGVTEEAADFQLPERRKWNIWESISKNRCIWKSFSLDGLHQTPQDRRAASVRCQKWYRVMWFWDLLVSNEKRRVLLQNWLAVF